MAQNRHNMTQSIRITDLENALNILRKSTTRTLNTTELIKLAVGVLAQLKKAKIAELNPAEMDNIGARLFYEWAKEDGSLDMDNIAEPEKLKPFTPKPYVRTR